MRPRHRRVSGRGVAEHRAESAARRDTALERGAWSSVDIAPATDHLLEVFGSARALYGSDWPVVKINSSLQGWYEAMVAMVGAYSEAEQRRIFCDNAVVWYGL